MEAWSQFFIRAGIPKDIAQKYAKSFTNNRITKEILPELDKSTLSELGVTAIGDQLCILRRIKAAKSAIERDKDDSNDLDHHEKSTPSQKIRITAPLTASESSDASEHRRGKPPPDRHEIYHVKMPEGKTHRSRQILQKHESMRLQGLAVRGTTGVRQGGRSVSPVDKNSLAARMHRKETSEVSSSTDRRQSELKISRISQSGIKKTITNRPSLSSRLTTTSGVPASSSLRIHVKPNRKKTSRMEGRLTTASKSPSGIVLYEEDMGYDEVMEEDVVEEYDEIDEVDEDNSSIFEEQVVTVPIRERISYTSNASGRLSSTVQRAPAPSNPRHVRHITVPSSSSRKGGNSSSSSSPSVFSRVSFNNRH